jgi:hypothetical protein
LSERVNREEEEEINAKAQRRKVAKGRQEWEGRRGKAGEGKSKVQEL